MITLKKSAVAPRPGILASSRFSESKKAGKGAIWFESSVQKLEEQVEEVYLTPEPPPSERGAPVGEPSSEDAPDERKK
jgi:hypothetical protein